MKKGYSCSDGRDSSDTDATDTLSWNWTSNFKYAILNNKIIFKRLPVVGNPV
jgi:hypothetical protein